eukprot:PITA_23922
MMAELAHFPLLLIMAAIMIAVGVAADDPQSKLVGEGCSPHMYVNATAFTDNLDSVLQSLFSNLSSDGFATSMQIDSGKTDPVYGLAVCRRYLNASECSQCVKEASIQAKAVCPQVNGARIHLDGCLLRYENNTFYSQDVDPGNYASCAGTNSIDSQTAQVLSAQLINNASENNGYAVGSIDGSLYGLVQCWPSLTISSCQRCMTEAQNKLLTCPPQSEGRGLEAGCFMRYSTCSFFTNKQTSACPNLTPSSGKSSSKTVSILLGSIGGAALITVMCFILFCRFSRRIKQRENCKRTDENLAARGNFEEFIFDYELLRYSTANFDRNNMLGRGGFGEVYKGTLSDGRVVAVKKLKERQEITQAAEEFLTEVRVLTSVRHRNLVRLLGCCTEGRQRLLVYEYMSNNSLNKHLFGEIESHLSWESRLNIIVGTARGLSYLHEDSIVRIIHRDIKCGNILLDDKFNPKIADFGLARFFPEDESHVSTRFGGTIGYTAPEYAVHGQLTEKADIYSYGIVVLEIVSGRKSVDTNLPEPMQILLQWVWNQYENYEVLDIVDPTLEGQFPREQVLRVIKVALLCTQGSWALRPAMSQVTSMLTNNLEIVTQPIQPMFINALGSQHTNSSTTSNSATAAPTSAQSHGSVSVSLTAR